MWRSWMDIETPQGRLRAGAAISVGAHVLLATLFAAVAVDLHTPSREFVELNVGRFSQQQLTRMLRQAQRAAEVTAPSERLQTPLKRLPKIDVPTISPSEVERRLLPERVSLDDEKFSAPPPRPAGPAVPALQSLVEGSRKVLYEGARLELGPRPGEGIESEHVGSDIQPVFVIEGQLKGRDFHEATLTSVPDIPARTQVQLDLVVAPSGAVISVLVARKENAALESFAIGYLRRCRFDALPADAPQENQAGRITITFTPHVE